MASPHPRPMPPDGELRERAAVALAQHALFRNMSRRMLIDLVEKVGLTAISPNGMVLGRPGVLAVLEGGIRVRPNSPQRRDFQVGVYVAYGPELMGIDWDSERAYPTRPRPVRIVNLTANRLKSELPQIVVNALDPVELDRLIAVL